MADVYCEMSALEMDVEDGTTPLIPGLDPPPTANPPPQPLPTPSAAPTRQSNIVNIPSAASTRQSNIVNNATPSAAPTRQSNIVNNPRRPHQYQARRCLLHLVMRCPVCYRVPHQRNPRIFRQDGIRAILALIRDVFGVQLNPRELALFIAGYYA